MAYVGRRFVEIKSGREPATFPPTPVVYARQDTSIRGTTLLALTPKVGSATDLAVRDRRKEINSRFVPANIACVRVREADGR